MENVFFFSLCLNVVNFRNSIHSQPFKMRIRQLHYIQLPKDGDYYINYIKPILKCQEKVIHAIKNISVDVTKPITASLQILV